jgi:hypothetical protein
MLLLALAPLPYGYYTLLRLIVTIGAAGLGLIEYRQSGRLTVWAVLFGLVALLFNPLIPVYLSRNIWAMVDIAVAAMFISYWWSKRLL